MSVSSESDFGAGLPVLRGLTQDSNSDNGEDMNLLEPVLPPSPVKSPAVSGHYKKRMSRFSLDGDIVVGDHADISEEQLEACQDVFKRIMSQRFAKDFQEIEDHPNFYDLIETPMYLSKVEDKLDIPSYQDFAEFFSDIELSIRNGMTLHQDDPNMKVKGHELRKALVSFSSKYKKYLPRDALKIAESDQSARKVVHSIEKKKLRPTDGMRRILAGAVKLSDVADGGISSDTDDDGVSVKDWLPHLRTVHHGILTAEQDPEGLKQMMDGQVLKATELEEETMLPGSNQRDVPKIVDKVDLFPNGFVYCGEPKLCDDIAPDGPGTYEEFMAMLRDMVSRGVTGTLLASGVLSSFFINNLNYEVPSALKEWLLGLVASSQSLGPQAAKAIDRMVNCKAIRESLPQDSSIVVQDRLACKPWVPSAVPTVLEIRQILSKVGMCDTGDSRVAVKGSQMCLDSFEALVRMITVAACGKDYDSLVELYDLLVGILTSKALRATRTSSHGYVIAVTRGINAVVMKMSERDENKLVAQDHLSLLFEKGIVGNIWEALEICISLDYEPMRYNIALSCLCVALKSDSKYFTDEKPPPRELGILVDELAALNSKNPPINVKDEFLALYCALICANIVAMGTNLNDNSKLNEIQDIALAIKYKIPTPGTVVDHHSRIVFIRHTLEAMTSGNFLEVCLFSECGEQATSGQSSS